MTEYKLSMEILDLSKANNWDKARKEWYLDYIYEIPRQDDPETCLCGHYPIREVCVIKNKENGNEAIVGNCCVNKFIGLTTNKLFSSIKNVKKDNSKSFNADVIDLAYKRGIINDWEYSFYQNIWRKRKLSKKQLIHKNEINEKLLKHQDILAENRRK